MNIAYDNPSIDVIRHDTMMDVLLQVLYLYRCERHQRASCESQCNQQHRRSKNNLVSVYDTRALVD